MNEWHEKFGKLRAIGILIGLLIVGALYVWRRMH
jgi:hypothetical protein